MKANPQKSCGRIQLFNVLYSGGRVWVVLTNNLFIHMTISMVTIVSIKVLVTRIFEVPL